MAEADPAQPKVRASGSTAALLASAFVVSTCGLIYELLASTLASYLLGDSVTQFSTVIGSYLFAMGVGSWCSRYVKRGELRLFVRIELLIALLGGCSAAALFMLFPVVDHFRVALYGLVLAIGFLVGLEIPLLIRILRGFDFRETVSNVLTFDYVGALVASLLFPLLLMPHLGMIRTGFMFAYTIILVRLLGKRGIGQLSPFELVIIIALGSIQRRADADQPGAIMSTTACGDIAARVDRGVAKAALRQQCQGLIDDIALGDAAKVPADAGCGPVFGHIRSVVGRALQRLQPQRDLIGYRRLGTAPCLVVEAPQVYQRCDARLIQAARRPMQLPSTIEDRPQR